MTTPDFVARRVGSLKAFFQARLGRSWIRKLETRYRLPAAHSVFARHRVSLRLLSKIEEVAVSLGFSPSFAEVTAFERKNFQRALTLTDALALISHSDQNSPTLRRVFEVSQHRIRHKVVKDDVLSEEFRMKWADDDRMLHPVPAIRTPSAQVPALSVSTLLDDPAVKTDTLPLKLEAPTRGPGEAPANSLTPSSATLEVTREASKRVNAPPPEWVARAVGMRRRKKAVEDAIEALRLDGKLRRDARQRALEALYRKLDSILLQLELEENEKGQ